MKNKWLIWRYQKIYQCKLFIKFLMQDPITTSISSLSPNGTCGVLHIYFPYTCLLFNKNVIVVKRWGTTGAITEDENIRKGEKEVDKQKSTYWVRLNSPTPQSVFPSHLFIHSLPSLSGNLQLWTYLYFSLAADGSSFCCWKSRYVSEKLTRGFRLVWGIVEAKRHDTEAERRV